jgi:RNA polymerase sigma factor (sigma-70 family)
VKPDVTKLQLFMSHRAALVDYATPIVGDRMQAEDVVQEAYLRFVPAGGKAGAAVEQPVAYLYRIVRNLALDWTRRRGLEQRHRGDDPLWWTVPPPARTPEQDLLHRRDLDRVAAALGGLAPRTRRAVEMHRFGGHTLKEIAARLGVSEPTAHRLVRDGLVRLAAELGWPPDE